MKVNRFLLPGLLFVLFFSTVGVAQWTGNWIVSGKQMIDPTNLTSGADVKGWMTFEQVSQGAGMEIEALYAAIGIPADIPPQTAMKEMESILPGFEVDTVRGVVDAFLGIESGDAALSPSESSEPAAATPEPTPTSVPTAEPVPTVHVPVGDGLGDGLGEGEGTGPAPLASGEILAGADIKGSHTLQAIAEQAQIALPDLLAELNLPLDTDPGLRVRDLVEQGRVGEVDDLRTAVTRLQSLK